MAHDEGIATKNGENLNIQCLLMQLDKLNTSHEKFYHYHSYMELIYVLEGSIVAYIDDCDCKVEKDKLLMVYPNESHTYSADEDNKYIVVKFFPEILHSKEQSINEFEYIFNLSSHNHRHTRIIDGTENIKRLITDSYRRFSENKYTSELYVRANIINVCAEILDFWKDNGEIISIKSTVTADNISIIKKLIERIKDDCNIKTHEAAKQCGMSDGHFSRIFKSVVGSSFTGYVKSVKMDKAERMLKCTNMSVTEIAQVLNYATASHFIEDFHREKGASPKQYRMYVLKTER